VRTLKAWLADKTWQSAAELEGLFQQFALSTAIVLTNCVFTAPKRHPA
jgi:hypothetical protein